MKKIILLLSLIPSYYYSQVKTDLEIFGNSRGSVFEVTNTNIKHYPGIDGIPYLDENFHPITIDGYNKNLPSVRYNAYEDEMEFKVNNELQFVTKQNDLKFKFSDNGKVYFLTNYIYENKNINGYLVELVGIGKYKLYKKEKVQVIEYNNNVTNTYLKDKNPYFQKENDVYLVNNKGIYIKIPKNIKELTTLLNITNPKVVLDFTKQKNISLKKESDLILLFNFINSLK